MIKGKKANIMLSLLFFLMAMGVMVIFISPINDFLQMLQQSDNLNCKNYIYDGNANHSLSYNSTLNGGKSGDPLACLAIKLYLPYLLLVFLIGGIIAVLGGRAGKMFGFEDTGLVDEGY